MKKIHITYQSSFFSGYANYCVFFSKLFGRFDESYLLTDFDIDKIFASQNHHILSRKKGGGLWLWKPYSIYTTLLRTDIADGDIIFYSDSGSVFLRNVDLILDSILKVDQDVYAFELPLIEKQWTKWSLFKDMQCDSSSFKDSNQVNSSFQIVRKSKDSITFYRELLNACCNIEYIDADTLNSEEVIEHRYDQSIFSLSYKKAGFKVFKDATQFGLSPDGYTLRSSQESFQIDALNVTEQGRLFRYKRYTEKYGLVIFHNRSRNPISAIFLFICRYIFCKIGIYNKAVI